MNREQIERHLASAVAQATPNVLDEILAGNYQQDKVQPRDSDVIPFKKFRRFSGLIAACMLLLVFTGGYLGYNFHYGVSSIIELDVNPSIELSVSGAGKVISVRAANEDAVEILDDMDLKGVDLNVAVNAVLGSMVNHGYFDKQENSILVSVSNQSPQKAERLRKELVTNIEDCLAAQQVKAVVFDQNVNPTDQLVELAKQYGISYGKANFIWKLAEKDPALNMDELAVLSMDAISNLIQVRNIDISDLEEYEYGKKVAEGLEEKEEPSGQVSMKEDEDTITSSSDAKAAEEFITESGGSSGSLETEISETETSESQSVPQESSVGAESKPVTIDFLAFENNLIRVAFSGKVKWKTPAVSVVDKFGEYYPVKIQAVDDDMCEVLVYGLTSEGQYTITISGVKYKGAQKYDTVTGSLLISPEESLEPETTVQDSGGLDEAVSTKSETVSNASDPGAGSDFERRDLKVDETGSDNRMFFGADVQGTQKTAKISALTREDNNFILTLSESVNWAEAMVTLSDEKGNSYTAAILEAKDRKCILSADGMQPGLTYTLTLRGMLHTDSGSLTKAVIYFSIVN